MDAIERYQKTLEEYKNQLKGGRNVSLKLFCKEQHVNGRAMNKWMCSHGIYVHTLRKELLTPITACKRQDRKEPLFARIEAPRMDKKGEEWHDGILIELPGDVKIRMKTNDAVFLGDLLNRLKG